MASAKKIRERYLQEKAFEDVETHFRQLETKWEKALRLMASIFNDNPDNVRKKFDKLPKKE